MTVKGFILIDPESYVFPDSFGEKVKGPVSVFSELSKSLKKISLDLNEKGYVVMVPVLGFGFHYGAADVTTKEDLTNLTDPGVVVYDANYLSPQDIQEHFSKSKVGVQQCKAKDFEQLLSELSTMLEMFNQAVTPPRKESGRSVTPPNSVASTALPPSVSGFSSDASLSQLFLERVRH